MKSERQTQPAGVHLSVMRKHMCVRQNMLHLVMCLLASGCLPLSSHIYREYHLMTQSKTWDEAQIYCRKMHSDLATIGSHDDLKRLVSMTTKSSVTVDIWIGLKKTGVAESWLWSVGETMTSHGVAEYTNWASLPDSSHHCGGMRNDGKWLSALCTTKLPFVCQEAERSNGLLYVIFQEKTWRQALEHCRLNNSDLASVMSLTENLALQTVINENGPLVNWVWIGLFRDEWKWSDQTISSFRYWHPSQPNNDGICTLFNPPSSKWYDRGCDSSHPFVCYNEKTIVRKQIVRVEMQSNSFINFDDFAVREAILNQIQNNYKGAIYWRVQRDGKVFHKKEKKKTIKACDIR